MSPVPPGSSATVVGLGKILCWGELPLIVRGDSVVLPFASAEDAASIITLGKLATLKVCCFMSVLTLLVDWHLKRQLFNTLKVE